MPTTNTNTTRKPYYESVIEDAGLSPVTAEELQSKFDAVTRAEYDRQRTDLQNATNQYYNQLYNTQNTAMDTIRQANAQAVATGASRGIQAANELSAILGLQSESATGAAELANQATTLAQDETTAMLENMLNAETQAAEQNQALANILLQSGSVDVEGQNANTAQIQTLGNLIAQAVADGNTELANKYRQQLDTLLNQTNTPETPTKPDQSTVTNTLSGGSTFKFGGSSYVIESPQPYDLSGYADSQLQALGYSGADDPNIADGTTVSLDVDLPSGTAGSIATGLLGLMGYKGTYTYYRGNWYKSKQV